MRCPEPRGDARPSGSGGGTPDADASRTRAARRAKATIRRYVRANRLRFLWTLTYADEPGARADVVRHLRQFFEALRGWKGKLPACAVIERGDANGRLHVHLAVDRFLSVEGMAAIWRHGFVHVGDPRKLAGRVPPRRLAAYMSKYVAKQVSEVTEEGPKQRAGGEHRYLLTQGHTPERFTLRYRRAEDALERVAGLYGQPDVLIAFGDPQVDVVYGWWLSFPDRCLHPPPRPSG